MLFPGSEVVTRYARKDVGKGWRGSVLEPQHMVCTLNEVAGPGETLGTLARARLHHNITKAAANKVTSIVLVGYIDE